MKWMVCTVAALFCACERLALAPPPELALVDPVGPVKLVREATSKAEGGYDLFHPTRLVAVEGAIWLLETGNDQLVRFDSTLTHAAAFAREGEGPGELQFAQDLVVTGDRVLVAESGNGRVSTFDTAGAFRATLPMAESPRFVADLRGYLVTTLDFSPHYAYRVDKRGRVKPLASIPESIRRLASSDSATFLPAGPYIAATSQGDLLVLDQSVLALSRYDREGRLLGTRLLPEPFRTKLLERRLAGRKAFGARADAFVDSPAAKRMSVTSDGRILVLFSLPDFWGLLVDAGSWTARPLPLPENRRLHDILWSASDASLRGDRLYLLSGSQLYELATEGWR